jgi:prophage regulatory protein
MTKILRLFNVIDRTGLPRSTIYAYIEQGRFPTPIKIGARNVGWLDGEVSEWIERRVQETRTGIVAKIGEKP